MSTKNGHAKMGLKYKVKRFFCILAVSTLLFACLWQAAYAQIVTTKHLLDNGMTVLVTEIPSTTVVAVQALVKSGSVNEGQYLGCGTTHFIEHMLFKGTPTRPVGQISKEVKSLGGNINASTTFDYTFFTIELPQASWANAVDILGDMLAHASFDPKEVEREREVILAEIRLRNDSPESRLSQLVFSNVYTRHPYRHPIIGYEALFKTVTRDDLFRYYQGTYAPNNIIVSVAGNINTPDVLTRLAEVFKEFKPRPCLLRNLPMEPPQLSTRRYDEEYTTDLTRMSLAFQGVNAAHEDMFALDVLAMILGHGESSRLYEDVFKKRGLVYSIAASDFTPMDQGLFEISCLLDEKKVDGTITAIKNQISLIKKSGISSRELEKTKRQALSRYYSGRQAAADVAEDAAINEAFFGDFDFSKKYVQGVSRLTPDDIRRVANKYLVDEHLTVVVLKPKYETPAVASQSTPVAKPEIKKNSLDNGMTVLLKEDHTFPLISIRLALQGGLRQEPDDKNGISNLMADVWTKGTVSRTSQQIAQSAEERGVGLGGFSGQNSFGLSCDALSEDAEFCLSLLEDLVKNPTFPPSELAREKEQIRSAIEARDDDVFLATSRAVKEALFLKHPYRNDILGTLEAMDRITRDDVVNFYKALCVPNNMVLSVFGDFNSAKTLKLIKEKFSALSRKEIALRSHDEAPPEATREKPAWMPKEQAVVMFGFQGPRLMDPDVYGLEVLSSILASPLSGRMFTKIRDELGQAYTLGGSFTPGIDTGFIYFYVSTTDANIEKVKNILLGQIKELQENDITDEELASTKAYLKGTHQMGLETNASLAMMATLDELYGLGFNHYESHDREIDRVTKADIRRLAQVYLDVRKAAIVMTRPKRQEQP